MNSKKTTQHPIMAFSDDKIFGGFYTKQTKFQKLLERQQEKMLVDWSQAEIGTYFGEKSLIINDLKMTRK